MDLHSAYPFWLVRDGLIRSYPSLDQAVACDMVIMGAGITGALMAYHLGKAGHKVLMVDRRHPGMGSTSASTGLLQYEIDTPLYQLIKLVGERHAVRSYELCIEAIDGIESIVKATDAVADFERKPSFQYASSRSDVKKLRSEYELRRQHQLSELQWLESDEVKQYYGFGAPAGLISADGAQINAYRFTHHLLSYCIAHYGLLLYDTTEVTALRHHKDGVVLQTSEKQEIRAKKLVVCAGYESSNYLPHKVEIRHSTYAIISKILSRDHFWHEDSLIWETAVPYLYMRTTTDHRVLVGGRDDSFYNPTRRDRRLADKAVLLERDFRRKFPDIPFQTDFAWAGTFCGTKDGLPYIGAVPQRPHTYFALGFGGNGITFSLIAAQIITDAINGVTHPEGQIFAFQRT